MERFRHFLRRCERQLDAWGKPGWIGATLLGLLFVWPIGLFILGYMIWSERMPLGNWKKSRIPARGNTGNAAFDEYRRDTLRRLEEERDAFVGFLERLRASKDRAEFDQFMNERKTLEATTA